MSHSDSETRNKMNHHMKLKKTICRMKKPCTEENLRKLNRIIPAKLTTDLLAAVSLNNTENVVRLLEMGISPNSKDYLRRGALHIAVSKGYLEIVDVLLNYGADPNIRDSIMNTPLHLAVLSNNTKIIDSLIRNGAEVNLFDNKMKTPIDLLKSKIVMIRKNVAETVSTTKGDTKNLYIQFLEPISLIVKLTKVSFLKKMRKPNTDFDNLFEHLKNKFIQNINNTGVVDETQFDEQMDNIISNLENFNI